MRNGSRSTMALLLAATIAVGCATRTTTVTREKAGNPDETVVTTETEEVARPTGILSTGVHVIGEIIALPFRLVGGLISIIF